MGGKQTTAVPVVTSVTGTKSSKSAVVDGYTVTVSDELQAQHLSEAEKKEIESIDAMINKVAVQVK
jgi:hypothetical protein